MFDMNNIHLTHREKTLLFTMRFKKKVKPKFDVTQLVSFGLIASNCSEITNEIGERLKDGTYSITDFGRRFLIHGRKDFFTKSFPVIISFIALIKSFWPELMMMFDWIIEITS